MRFITSIIWFHLVVSLVAIGSDALLERNRTEWSLYKLEHGKNYDNQQVDALRMELYYQTKEYVETYNRERSQETGITLGLSHLSDWTMEEKRRLNGLRVPQERRPIPARAQKYLDDLLKKDSADVPDELDWRKVPGRVSQVKDQGNCGSCWAFSVTGSLEGQELAKNKTKTLIPLSEQNLVDCDTSDWGCNGGFMQAGFEFIKSNGGIEGESTYPYTGKDDECKFKAQNVVMTDSGAADMSPCDEEDMKKLVARSGPLTVGMDAMSETFHHYKKGIFKDTDCGLILDHGVLIVGYGTDKETNTDYWIVKNSWGADWGDHGYFKLVRGKNACAISDEVIVPIID